MRLEKPLKAPAILITSVLILIFARSGYAENVRNIDSYMPTGTIHVDRGTTLNILPGASLRGGTKDWAYGIHTMNTTVNVYGGSVTGGTGTDWDTAIQSDNSTINIYNGSISGGDGAGSWAYGIELSNSTLNFYGGTIKGGSGSWASGLTLFNSTANIYGGTIKAGTGTWANGIEIEDSNSTINIYGQSFTRGFGQITDVAGTINGTFADGSLCSINFAQHHMGHIYLLPVPEPSSILALLCGLSGLAYCRKRPQAK